MMKKIRLTKLDISTALLTLGSVIPGAAVYGRLPEKIATHFNINNQPDGWSGKAFAVFGIPLIMTAMHLLICLLSNSDERLGQSNKVNTVVRFIVPVMAFTVETIMVLYALGRLTNIGTVTLCLLAVLMIVLGNYMPKSRPNKFFGVRTPKTLSDEAVWNKVHRFTGYVMMIAGIVLMILALMDLFIPALIVMTVAILIPLIYTAVI